VSNATHIEVEAGRCYWEDATVNGVIDHDGTLMPGRDGDLWKARIRLSDGQIENWPAGTAADIHYKVCDEGRYWLTDSNGNRLARWRGYYVPDDFLCPEDAGHGDYIIMRVAESGLIEGWPRPPINPKDWIPVQ